MADGQAKKALFTFRHSSVVRYEHLPCFQKRVTLSIGVPLSSLGLYYISLMHSFINEQTLLSVSPQSLRRYIYTYIHIDKNLEFFLRHTFSRRLVVISY